MSSIDDLPAFYDDAYKHLIFKEVEPNNLKVKTPHKVIHVYNKHDKDRLGEIQWFEEWKKYIFIPVWGFIEVSNQLTDSACIAFHDGCLHKIADICTQLTKMEKEA